LSQSVPATLSQSGASTFWLAVLIIGAGTGGSAIVLSVILQSVQHMAWPADSQSILSAAQNAGAWHHLWILAMAGALTGGAQLALVRLTSGNGIDITEAIWFNAGRLPVLRTLGSAVLSVIIVGMGASLGREGAPKQFGAVIANLVSDRGKLSDEQRRLLVACGSGAGMASAYGVPLGGALFALEVVRGALALRMVLPALLTSLVATAISWLVLPDAPTYTIPEFQHSLSVSLWALPAGAIAGLVSVAYVRLIAFADRNKPKGWYRLLAPVLALSMLGGLSIAFPQLLGNGKEVSQLAFDAQVAPSLLIALLLLKPLATALCLGSGAPGGLFTPSLALGALLGGLLGHLWSYLWPGTPVGLFSVIGAAAVLAATTQGPISAVVLMMELTGRDRSFIVPLLLAVVVATMVSRSLELRSIYEARLSEAQVEERRKVRARSAV
jgi:CIC family chloride channel protein